MNYTQIDDQYLVRLSHTENLFEKLTTFCQEKNIVSGKFNAIGAFDTVTLGFYHLNRKEYTWKDIDSAHEIVSLTGNITQVDNQPLLHIHCVLSNSEFAAFGGHLKAATVGATCEIILTPFSKTITREFDQDTGLKLIHCEV